MIEFKKDILEESSFPESWNFHAFDCLKNFSARKKYCDSLLKKIGQGTGRSVYNIDDQYVLKLARNAKGVAQNAQEYDFINDGGLGNAKQFFANIEMVENNNLYLISELCNVPNTAKFKESTGVPFAVFSKYVEYITTRRYAANGWAQRMNWDKFISRYSSTSKSLSFDVYIEQDGYGPELLRSIERVSADYDMMTADWERISSYGVKNSTGNVVITDYGLNQDVYTTYYTGNKTR